MKHYNNALFIELQKSKINNKFRPHHSDIPLIRTNNNMAKGK